MKRAVVLTSLCLLINGSVSAFNGEHLLQACVIAQAPLTPDAVRQSGYQRGYCMGAVDSVLGRLSQMPPDARRAAGICLKGDEIPGSLADLTSERRAQIVSESLAALGSEAVGLVVIYLRANQHLLWGDHTRLITAAFAKAHPCP